MTSAMNRLRRWARPAALAAILTATLGQPWTQVRAQSGPPAAAAPAKPSPAGKAGPPAMPTGSSGCPQGPFESPDSCSGRPLLSPSARLRLQGGPASLPDAKLGAPYAFQLVKETGPQLSTSNIDPHLPKGLKLDTSGAITGVPTETGDFHFTLTIFDPSATPSRVSQDYVLRVLATAPGPGPRPGPGPKPKPALGPPPRPADTEPGAIVIYELTAAEVADLAVLDASAAVPKATKYETLYIPQKPGAQGVVAATGQPAGAQGTAPRRTAAPSKADQTAASAISAGAKAPAGGRLKAVGAALFKPPSTAQIAKGIQYATGGGQSRAAAPPTTAGAPSQPQQPQAAPQSSAASTQQQAQGPPSAPKKLAVVQGPPPAPPPPPTCPPPPDDKKPAQPQKTLLPECFLKAVAPVENVPYPTRALFSAALAARVTLSPDVAEMIADRSRRVVSYSKASAPRWASAGGCRCNPPPDGPDDKVVYGFFAFWRPSAEGPALTYNFDHFNRVGVVGAQLVASSPQSAHWLPAGTGDWWAGLAPFARTAQGHGVKLDLVLQASDLSFVKTLQTDAERKAFYAAAATDAIQRIDTQFPRPNLHSLLVPGIWNDSRYVFDGVTVMFAYPPPGTPADELAAFHDIYVGFLDELVHQMQNPRRDGRPLALNIVAPDDLDDAKNEAVRAEVWEDFLKLKRSAEPQSEHAEFDPKAYQDLAKNYTGTTRISVRLLTPLREQTTNTKKAVRAALDHIDLIKGPDRVEVQRSTVPILYVAEAPYVDGKPQVLHMNDDDSRQLRDDMVYMKQNFGGLALWPMPESSNTEVYDRLHQVFFSEKGSLFDPAFSICNLLARLAFQLLVALSIAGSVFYLIWGSASGRRVTYMTILWVTIGLTVVAFAVLLEIDPAWEVMRRGNGPFFLALALFLAYGVFSFFRSRVPRP